MELNIDFRIIIAAVSWFSAAIVLLSLLLVLRASWLSRGAASRNADLASLRPGSLPPRRYLLEWMVRWNQAQDAARAEADAAMCEHLNEVALRAGMRSTGLAWTTHREIVNRLAAIAMLGHLRDVQAAPVLRALCDSSNAVVSLAAARALLQIDPSFADRFAAAIGERADWSPGTLIAVVRAERHLLEAPLLDVCRTAALPRVRATVPYLRYLQPEKAIPTLRYLLQTVADAETLAAALKVLAAIGGAADGSAAAKLTADERWQVRVQAANALAVLGEQSHIGLLAGMLNDTHWWVRYRAAQAVAALAARFNVDLGPVLAHREDPFARDALTQAIAERSNLLQRGAAG